MRWFFWFLYWFRNNFVLLCLFLNVIWFFMWLLLKWTGWTWFCKCKIMLAIIWWFWFWANEENQMLFSQWYFLGTIKIQNPAELLPTFENIPIRCWKIDFQKMIDFLQGNIDTHWRASVVTFKKIISSKFVPPHIQSLPDYIFVYSTGWSCCIRAVVVTDKK